MVSIKRLLIGHLQCLDQIFNPGKSTGNTKKMWMTKELKSTVIPVLSILMRDHKPVKDVVPESRPVYGTRRSINSEMSEWGSSRAEPIDEVIISEEMLAKVKEVVK